jgi:hypothetical protein
MRVQIKHFYTYLYKYIDKRALQRKWTLLDDLPQVARAFSSLSRRIRFGRSQWARSWTSTGSKISAQACYVVQKWSISLKIYRSSFTYRFQLDVIDGNRSVENLRTSDRFFNLPMKWNFIRILIERTAAWLYIRYFVAIKTRVHNSPRNRQLAPEARPRKQSQHFGKDLNSFCSLERLLQAYFWTIAILKDSEGWTWMCKVKLRYTATI